MIQSARQKRKKRQDIMGIIGIVGLLFLGAGGVIFIQSNNDPLDEYQCSIKNGPNAVTAIIFDKSDSYNKDQIADIKTSFNLWLSGNEATTKNRKIDLDFFKEGNLVQLYVIDENNLNLSDVLKPEAQLCVPKDFRDANIWVENQAFLKADYDNFISTFSSIIEGLLDKSDDRSPIMETIVRLSNSESFQNYPDVPHNIFLVSDMVQYSDNWDQIYNREGNNWDDFSNEMKGTVYTNLRLNEVQVQVFYAKRKNYKSIQTTSHAQFWVEFFRNSGADISELNWVLIDG